MVSTRVGFSKVITLLLFIVLSPVFVLGASDDWVMDIHSQVYDTKDDLPNCSGELTETNQFRIIEAYINNELHPLTKAFCDTEEYADVNSWCELSDREVYEKYSYALENNERNFLNLLKSSSSNCWESSQIRLADDQDMGIILGGYLYATETTDVAIHLRNRFYGKSRINSYAMTTIYDVNVSDGGSVDFLADYDDVKFMPRVHGYVMNSNNDHTGALTREKVIVNPGIYYVTIIFYLEGDKNDVSEHASISLTSKFIDYADDDKYLGASHTEEMYNSKFSVKDDWLGSGQVKEAFPDLDFDTEEYKDFCLANGNYFLTDEMRTATGYTSGYNTNNLCCGNDVEETDSNRPVHNGDYVCTDQGWVPFLDLSVYTDDDYYCGDVAEDFDSIKTTYDPNFFSYEANDGSDGCCGDDIKPRCQLKQSFSCSSANIKYDCNSYDSCTLERSFSCGNRRNSSGCYGMGWNHTTCKANDCPYTDARCTGEVLYSECEDLTSNDCSEKSDICEWVDSTDDFFLFTDDYKQFCENSYSSSDSDDFSYYYDITSTDPDNSWLWWDANLDNYMIHSMHEDYDYVSNAKEWYVCDNDDSFGDNSVSFLESFPIHSSTFSSVCSSRQLEKLDSIELVGTEYFNFIISNYGVCGNELQAEDIEQSDWENAYYNYITALNGLELDPNDDEAVIERLEDDFFIGCCYKNDGGEPAIELDFFETGCSNLICHFDSDHVEEYGGEPEDSADTLFVNKDDFFSDIVIPISDSCAGVGRFTGQQVDVCDDNERCVTPSGAGMTLKTDEGICCVNGVCQDPTDLSCSELGGFLITNDETVMNCTGEVLESGFYDESSEEVCCFGGYTINDHDDLTELFPVNQSFICHDSLSGQSAFAECCADYHCYNARSWSASKGGIGLESQRAYSKGSQLMTVVSYDYYDVTNDVLVDRIINRSKPISVDPPDYYLDDYQSIPELTKGSWDGYYSLTLDLMYQGPYALDSIVFKNSNDNIFSVDLSDKTIIPPLTVDNEEILLRHVWHRVTIPFDDSFNNFADNSIITHYAFNFTHYQQGYFGDEVRLFIDNLVLHEENDINNYYCAGNYRVWLDDLIAKDVDNDGSLSLKEYGPEQTACNAQMSFSWTGSRCCGYQSTRATPDDYTLAEYYDDSSRGCWGGVNILDDTIVPYAFGGNLDAWPHILYKRGVDDYTNNFWSCNTYLNETSAEGVTCDDTTCNITGAGSSSVEVGVVKPFSIIGSWFCDPGDGDNMSWQPVDNLREGKVLVTQLYNMSGDDYALHCDQYVSTDNEFDVSALLNSNPLVADGTSSVADDAHVACVLKNYTGNAPSDSVVTLGVALNEDVDVDDFIAAISDSFYPLRDDDQPVICSEDVNGASMPSFIVLSEADEKFFIECQGSGDGYLRAYYNNPLGLLLLTIDDGVVSNNLFVDVWVAIRSFFTGLFDGLSADKEVKPVIPLDLDAQADFSRLYLARDGGVGIVGIMEHDGVDEQSADNWFVRVDYFNFSSSVNPLVDGFRNAGFSHFGARNCVVGENQSIFMSFPTDSGLANNFDWRYLTSNLRLQDMDSDGVPYLASDNACWLHNGRIDGDEVCDDIPSRRYVINVTAEGVDNDRYCDPNTNNVEKLCVNGRLDDSVCDIDYFVVFATSNVFDGALGGVDGANAKCHEAAVTGGIIEESGVALAVISDSASSAANVFANYSDKEVYAWADDSKYYSVDTTNSIDNPIIIDNLFDETFRTSHAYVFDENRETFAGSFWTGSTNQGAITSSHCGDWYSSDVSGYYGTPSYQVGGRLLSTSVAGCHNDKSLLCLVPINN